MELCFSTACFAEWGQDASFEELHRYSRISIGFAAQNLQSPISNFGHTFLIFHNQTVPEPDSLVVEFTGTAPTFLDHVSALFLSIPGKYSPIYWSEKKRSYDLENRALWIYGLALNNKQVELIRQYLLQNQHEILDYDFSNKNCAFYINELIRKGRGDLIYHDDGLFITPISSLKWLQSEKLFSSTYYSQSTQQRALTSYVALSDSERSQFHAYLNGLATPTVSALNLGITNSLATTAEHLIPREADANIRNRLYAIKKQFSLSASTTPNSISDPSKSVGPASVSLTTLPKNRSHLLTLSPGFIRFENESNWGFTNASLETLRNDWLVDQMGKVSLNQFTLVNMEVYQPSQFLQDGYTQTLSASYVDYRAYLNKKYSEIQLMFGRGISELYMDHTFSLIPTLSLVKAQQNNQNSTLGRAAMRARIYHRINDDISYAVQLDQVVNNNSELQQALKFNIKYIARNDLSLSLAIQRIRGKQQETTLIGFTGTKMF